ncbi:hypothetical protein COS54_02875 [Candidatus Shapirobacteria bacterium CG03_land_8_20_14_0_80_39_12]|uniref:Solute-binding protein family 5 domain-containing protein n=1 Tax=Candidatus Shapirobacteria bacterium CG03_land_8_20_14_0_80_39_12 TaxID=1974879 RepID=A0A2M7BBN4_9BACT|nr:MAG: hypothetical protein COS54_02875 [Candidatus Shapirobacteria bacterium CG03_land_8_20_14_0_80_39_12]
MTKIFKKLRFLFLFLKALVVKEYRIILLGLVLGSICFIILPKIGKIIPRLKKTEKVGIVGQFTINNLPDEVLKEISSGLTGVSAKGEAVPLIAESWELTDQGTTYLFKLKSSPVIWHDGHTLDSKDINYNFEDVNFTLRGGFLKFTLKEPFSPFPIVLSRPLFKKGLVGLGKYRVSQIQKSGNYIKSILLVPYGQSSIFQSSAVNDLPKKLYRFYNNENDLKTAFNLGEINYIAKIFDLNKLLLTKAATVKKEVMKDAYIGAFFNSGKPPFQEKTFRQAVAYAIAKESDDHRALGPLNPASWAYNPDVKPYLQDFTRAKELIGKDKSLPQKIIISAFPQYEKLASQIKENLKMIGLSSEVRIVSFIPEDFDIFIIAREIPPDPDQYYFWHSNQAGNFFNYSSPRIDKLLEDGRKTADKEERKNIYFDFQRFLVEDSPAVFLTHPTFYSVTRN